MADKPKSAAAEIAREANAYILALDASLYEMTVHALGPDPEPIDLFARLLLRRPRRALSTSARGARGSRATSRVAVRGGLRRMSDERPDDRKRC